MMCFTDLYRITQQEQKDRLDATRRGQLLHEAHDDQHRTLERLRRLVGTLMAMLA